MQKFISSYNCRNFLTHNVISCYCFALLRIKRYLKILITISLTGAIFHWNRERSPQTEHILSVRASDLKERILGSKNICPMLCILIYFLWFSQCWCRVLCSEKIVQFKSGVPKRLKATFWYFVFFFVCLGDLKQTSVQYNLYLQCATNHQNRVN